MKATLFMKNLRERTILLLSLVGTIFFTYAVPASCSPSSEEAVAAFGLDDIFTPRRPIPYHLLGINAFANDRRFGAIRSQLLEVRSTLKLRRLRILVAWNDPIQGSPRTPPDFGLYDRIISSLPSGTEALLIITGVPSWMNDPKNWVDNNPRKTFVELWVKKVVSRYANRGRVKGFQIWNEPNNPDFSENITLDVLTKPEHYVELLALAHSAAKKIAPRKQVINGATTAIAQNYPSTLSYNQDMIEAGALSFTDAYAVHYYGKHVERVLLPGGVGDFLRSISKPIWITETGIKGINKQAEYAERIFPFLKKQVPGIARIYIYQFTESSPATSTFGLRNLTPGLSISDLYIKLRDRS